MELSNYPAGQEKIDDLPYEDEPDEIEEPDWDDRGEDE